jgi:hypothetical protein
MHLVEILLPLNDNEKRPVPPAIFSEQKKFLSEKFGGMTAFMRAPAEGIYEAGSTDQKQVDQIVIFEVMCEQLDREWWKTYRVLLEEKFSQDEILIRAHEVERL